MTPTARVRAKAALRPRKLAATHAVVTRAAVQYAVARRGLPSAVTVRSIVRASAASAAAVTVRFVGLREGRALNARFRGKDHATNVLTFVYDDGEMLAGDVVLCVPVLRREARAGGKSVIAHCAHLLVHGMLHLQGHDHLREADALRMERRESALLAALGYPDPYST